MNVKNFTRSAGCAAMITALLLGGCERDKTAAKKEILLLCGGSMRAPMESVVKHFNEHHSDIEVVSTYGGSGELMAQLQQTNKGDIYVCHDPFMEWGEQKGIIDRWTTVGYLDVVLAVPKGNPKNIHTFADLAKPGLRLGLGDERYSTTGWIVKNMLEKVSYADSIRANVRMETKGHQSRATDVSLGSLDATIIWNAVADLYKDKLDIIPLPKDKIDAVTSATYKKSDLKKIKVTVGMTSYGKNKPHVKKFYEYVEKESPAVFAANGLTPLEGVAP
ncbi:MAG: extracellular solute-binding protein [Chitinispirillaceae bacterium]